MLDYKNFNHQLNGLWPDILAQYGIEVPKMVGQNSINHPCPLCGGHDRAHWRDVGGRLALYCRGCAPDTMHSVENVIMEYSGIDFWQFVKDAANFINHVPIETLKKVQAKISEPPKPIDYQKKAEEFLLKCKLERKYGIDFYRHDNGFCLPLINWYGEIESVANFEIGKRVEFINPNIGAAFTPIKVKESDNWLVIESMSSARFIAHNNNINVAVAWTSENVKTVSRLKPDWIKSLPVFESECYYIDAYCLFKDYKLRRVVR